MDGQTIININGKNVGVKFSVYGVQEMTKVKDFSLPEQQEGEEERKTTLPTLLAMIWGGILGYAFAKQQEPAVTFEELFDWLEVVQLSGDKTGEIEKINTAFETSQVYDKLLKPMADKKEPADAKKKQKNLPR